MIGVFKSSNGQFFFSLMVTTIQGLGGNTMPWLFTSTIERIFYTIQTHLSRGEIFFKSLESCQKVFCPNGTNLSKAHRTSVTPIKRSYTVVEKFKNETISIWNDLLFLIIQCVISALLIFRASDIFCQIDLLGRDQKPLAMLLLQFLEIHSLHFTFFSLDPF